MLETQIHISLDLEPVIDFSNRECLDDILLILRDGKG